MESAIDHPDQPDVTAEGERRRDLLVEVSKLDSPSRARAFGEPQLVDWFLVILALERKGHTTYTLAEQTKIPRATIGGWRCGNHLPSHHGGEALIALWMDVTGLPRAELPVKTGGQLSAARVK